MTTDLILVPNERFNYLKIEESYSLSAELDPRYKPRTFHKQSTISTPKMALTSESLKPQPSTNSEPSATW